MVRRLRRELLALAWPLLLLPLLLAACANLPTPPSTSPPDWQARLGGDTLVLLGELHDRPALHAARLAVLRTALEAGWRPAIVMEQFDTDRQSAIDQARRERPADPDHLLERLHDSGWDWQFYRPVVALAYRYDLPLVAGNLARTQASRLVRTDTREVFEPARHAALRLDKPIDPAWRAAQQRVIEVGHCGALPARLLPGMARAQFARDAVMAELLRRHGTRGAVLLAGNGHVRRDLGVPRWLDDLPAGRVFAVGFIEPGAADGAAFDAVVVQADTRPAAQRQDPCAGLVPERFERRPQPDAQPRLQ